VTGSVMECLPALLRTQAVLLEAVSQHPPLLSSVHEAPLLPSPAAAVVTWGSSRQSFPGLYLQTSSLPVSSRQYSGWYVLSNIYYLIVAAWSCRVLSVWSGECQDQ
jgi:hypothetical protein